MYPNQPQGPHQPQDPNQPGAYREPHQQAQAYPQAPGFPQGGPQQPGFPPGYQAPNWYQQPKPRRNNLIIGIAAAVVVAVAVTLTLIFTLGGKSETANPSPSVPCAVGNPACAAPTGSVNPVPNPGPNPAPNPAGGALTSRATAERVASLISTGQPNVAGVYACTAERAQFVSENTAPTNVSVVVTVTNVTENGATASAAIHVAAKNTQDGRAQESDATVGLARNNAGAWLICTSPLGAGDQGIPNEAGAPAAGPVNTGGEQPAPSQPTGGQNAGPTAEEATQVAQGWAAAINSGDVAAAQQFVCSANKGKTGQATPGLTMTLTGLSGTGVDTAVAEFEVSAEGQTGTAQVAMTVENGHWTMCQQG